MRLQLPPPFPFRQRRRKRPWPNGAPSACKGLLEAAALIKDWAECNAQTAALEPFADGEEVTMFYAAVALRETGSIASARTPVSRARPFLVPSPFVDWYTKEILGN